MWLGFGFKFSTHFFPVLTTKQGAICCKSLLKNTWTCATNFRNSVALKLSSLCCLLLATVVVVKVVLMPFLFPCLMGDLINF